MATLRAGHLDNTPPDVLDIERRAMSVLKQIYPTVPLHERAAFASADREQMMLDWRHLNEGDAAHTLRQSAHAAHLAVPTPNALLLDEWDEVADGIVPLVADRYDDAAMAPFRPAVPAECGPVGFVHAQNEFERPFSSLANAKPTVPLRSPIRSGRACATPMECLFGGINQLSGGEWPERFEEGALDHVHIADEAIQSLSHGGRVNLVRAMRTVFTLLSQPRPSSDHAARVMRHTLASRDYGLDQPARAGELQMTA